MVAYDEESPPLLAFSMCHVCVAFATASEPISQRPSRIEIKVFIFGSLYAARTIFDGKFPKEKPSLSSISDVVCLQPLLLPLSTRESYKIQIGASRLYQ